MAAGADDGCGCGWVEVDGVLAGGVAPGAEPGRVDEDGFGAETTLASGGELPDEPGRDPACDREVPGVGCRPAGADWLTDGGGR